MPVLYLISPISSSKEAHLCPSSISFHREALCESAAGG